MRQIQPLAPLLLVVVVLLSGLPSFGQALPGYDRARVDQIRNEKNRRSMDAVAATSDELAELSTDDWKGRAVTWGLAEHRGEHLRITSESEFFDDLERLRTRDDEAEPRREGTELKARDASADIWVQLPERAQAPELRCRLSGGDNGELFAIFWTDDRQYVCDSRPVG